MAGIYIAISIVVLAIIAIVLIYTGKSSGPKRLSNLPMFAALFIVLGIVLTDEGRLVSYSFMGGGVFIAAIDIARNSLHKQS